MQITVCSWKEEYSLRVSNSRRIRFKYLFDHHRIKLGINQDGRSETGRLTELPGLAEEADGHKGPLLVPRLQALIEFRRRKGLLWVPLWSPKTFNWKKKNAQCKSDFQFSSVQSLSRVWLFVTPWTAAPQASLSIINSRSLLKLMSTESVMPSNPLILCCPLLLLPSIFPHIRVFSNESILCIRWPKYWNFSLATVLPMNIQGWFPLGLTGLISLQSKGLRDFTEDYSLGNSLSIALRKLSPGGRGRSHYIYDFWLGNIFNQAHISVKITVSHKDR